MSNDNTFPLSKIYSFGDIVEGRNERLIQGL